MPSINYNDKYKVVIGEDTLEISVLDYLDMEKNYHDYLETIKFFGGFMTYDHLVLVLKYKYKRSTVFTTLNEMVDKGYLRKESLGKYNYVILGKKAQVYINKIPKANHILKPNQAKMLSRLLLADYLIKDVDVSNITIRTKNDEKYSLIDYLGLYESLFNIQLKKFYTSLFRDTEIIEDKELMTVSDWEIRGFGEAPKFISPKEVIYNQYQLLNSENIRIDHKNGKGAVIKKTYDILGKLILRNIYISKSVFKDNTHIIEVLVLDIDREKRWFKSVIEDVDHLVSTIYFNALQVLNKKIKIDFKIITDNPNKVNDLQKYLNTRVAEMKAETEHFIKNHVAYELGGKRDIQGYGRGGREIVYWEKNKKHILRKNGEYSGRVDPIYLFWVNEIKVISFNTVRFFETRADNVDIITKDTFKIVDLK
ncbi:MAG: hypothetical protein ACRC3Y_09685 [Romboutsia sp.]|uniref:hypothetical protein n=1 Tax=Romboutsia sp. TaxID=1965302 RepID=UPI003F2E8456